MTQRNETGLTTSSQRSTDGRPNTTQLSALAGSFNRNQLSNLVSNVIHGDNSNSLMTGAILASDTQLDQLLNQTAVYRMRNSPTPSEDFAMLSVGSSTQVAEALRRLTVGFFEVRSTLAHALGQIESDQSFEIEKSFQKINASYILVIATVHELFNRPDKSYRENLWPSFQQLLEVDPYLSGLAPSFAAFREAASPEARQIALRQFFETFCEQATQPTLYDEHFSALVQAILLRELRYVIGDETTKPVEQRRLAPYLAQLFEGRMRNELETARLRSDDPQPVLEALRKCPGEAKLLMQQVTQFLLESSKSENVSISLSQKSTIACEVMLSIGCLLSETRLTEYLSKLLDQVDDLNPALVVVFSSAIKFSLYEDEHQTRTAQIDPIFLIKKGLMVASQLSDLQSQRLFDEILYPLADHFVAHVSQRLADWTEMPPKLREACLEKILLREVIGLLNKEDQDLSTDETIHAGKIARLLISHLIQSKFKPESVNPSMLRWLANEGSKGSLDEEQVTNLMRVLVQRKEVEQGLGLSREKATKLFNAGGISTIGLLSRRGVLPERIADLINRYAPNSPQEIKTIAGIFETSLVKPLRNQLADYSSIIERERDAGAQVMLAQEELSLKQRTARDLAKNERHLDALVELLEENVDYLRAEVNYAKASSVFNALNEESKSLRTLSTKELFDAKRLGRREAIKDELKTVQDEINAIKHTQFKLPTPFPDSLKDFAQRRVSLADLEAIRLSISQMKPIVEGAEAGSATASNQLSKSKLALNEHKQRVFALFNLIQIAARSPALAEVNPEKLNLQPEGTFDLLGIFCRISITAQLFEGKPKQEIVRISESLEKDIKKAIQLSLKDPNGKDDLMLVLSELERLIKQKTGMLRAWPEAASTEDTAVAYSIDETPVDASLAEYLYRRLRSDINNPETSWLSNEAGWDERFHLPIITIFSDMLTDGELSRDHKKRAMKAVYYGIAFWVRQEILARKIEEQNNDLIADKKRRVPDLAFSSLALIPAWTGFLQASRGIAAGRVNGDNIRFVTSHLVAEIGELSQYNNLPEFERLIVPFAKVIGIAKKELASSLQGDSSTDNRFLDGVRNRLLELRRQQSLAQKSEIASTMTNLPPPPVVEGIDLGAVKSQGLYLPAPARRSLNQGRISDGRVE